MLRNLFFIPIMLVDTIISACSAMVVGVFNRYSPINHSIVRNWARIIIRVSGSALEVEGIDHIKAGQSYIIVANHQSHLDIPVLASALPVPLKIISKKELFRIPIFGWGMWSAGMLSVDRSNRTKAVQTLNQAEAIIRREHLSILAFPEGTRSEDGKIQPFKKGPIIVSINTGLPILPISVSGTRRILPKGRLFIRKGRIRVFIHPPVSSDQYTLQQRNELVKKVQDTVISQFIENY